MKTAFNLKKFIIILSKAIFLILLIIYWLLPAQHSNSNSITIHISPFHSQDKKSSPSNTPIGILGGIENLRERREEAKGRILAKTGRIFSIISSIDYSLIPCLTAVYVSTKFHLRE